MSGSDYISVSEMQNLGVSLNMHSFKGSCQVPFCGHCTILKFLLAVSEGACFLVKFIIGTFGDIFVCVYMCNIC